MIRRQLASLRATGSNSRTTSLHPIPPTLPQSRHHNPRASLRIRIRLVMAQRNAKMPAHIRQFRRADIPLRPRQLHGANERQRRRRQRVGITASTEHTFIERRVMRRQKRDPLQLACHRGPDRIKPRRILHVVPRQTMNIREGEFPRGRTNPLVPATHNAPVLDHDNPQRASTVPAVIGGLEVDGGELGHGAMCIIFNICFLDFALTQENVVDKC